MLNFMIIVRLIAHKGDSPIFYSIFICFYVLFLGEAGETLMNDANSVAEEPSSRSFHDHSYSVSGFF